MTNREYIRLFGAHPEAQAIADGYFAARERGAAPLEWSGLELGRGKRYTTPAIRRAYAKGFQEGCDRNLRDAIQPIKYL